MSDIPDDIPTSGRHRGGEDAEYDARTNVRAQDPPSPEEKLPEPSPEATPAREGARPTFQLLYNESEGHYQVRSWKDADEEIAEGYRELGRFDSPTELEDTTSSGMPEGPRYVVFEKRGTGEVMYSEEQSVSGSWTDENRFDQITIFDTEQKAKEYAESRQNEAGR